MVTLRKPTTISIDKNDSEDTNNKKTNLNRNRSTLFYEDDDDKPNQKFEEKIQKDHATSSAAPTNDDNTAPPSKKRLINSTPSSSPSTSKESNTKLRISEHKTDYGNTSITKKRPLSPLLSSQVPNNNKKLKSPEKKYKSFNKLFEDVIFTISGIQVRKIQGIF